MKNLPHGWCSVGLRELIGDGVFTDGDWVESKDQDPKGSVRLIQLADVGVARFVDKSARFLTREKAAELGCTYLEPGDVLISRMADPIGRACLFPGVGQPCVTVVDVCIARPAAGRADARWLMGAINSPQFRASIELAASGTTRTRISRGNLGVLPLPIPPLNEQRRIVAKLEALQTRSRRAREALDAVPPLLEKLRQSILASAFRGDLTKDWRAQQKDLEPATELLKRIRIERREKWESAELAELKSKGKPPTDDRWKTKYAEPKPVDVTGLPSLPLGWAWATFETVAEVDLGRQRAPQYQTGRFTRPYLRVANIKDDRIDVSDVLSMDFDEGDFAHYALEPGDILLSEGQSPELVGQSAIYEGGIDGLCFQKTLHRFRRYPSGPSPHYAQMLFRHYVKSGLFRSIASLTVNIAHLTLVRLKPLHFPVPPKDEEIELVRRVQGALERVTTLERALHSIRKHNRDLDRAILAKAFRGELVPQDPNDEPAEVMLARARSATASTPAIGAPQKRGRPRSPQRADQPND